MKLIQPFFLTLFLIAFHSTLQGQYKGTEVADDSYSISLPAWGVTGGVEHWTLRYASLGIARKHRSKIESITSSHIHYTDLSFRQSTTDWSTSGVELSHAFVDMLGGGGRVSYYWNEGDATLALQPFAAFNYRNLVASFGYNFYVSDIRLPELLDFSLRIQYFLPVLKPVTRDEFLRE